MRLTDNSNADDDLSDNNLKEIPEKKTAVVGKAGQFRIDCMKLCEKTVDAVAEMFIT